MNRTEFKHHVLRTYADIGDSVINDEEPFWVPEYREGWKASCFIVTKCIPLYPYSKTKQPAKSEFWGWCRNNLSKVPMCFMSDTDNDIEWWGLNNEEDCILFMLRWS